MASKRPPLDPYAGNVLTTGLGPIRARTELHKLLTELPPRPTRDIASVPLHIRRHLLMDIRDFHLPSLEELHLHESIDLMIRRNYKYLDPSSPRTWSLINGEPFQLWKRQGAPHFAAAVEGISGTGKTEAIRRCLATYPEQVIRHESFFKMANGLDQVVWLSIDVPSRGRPADLAAALMTEWKRVTGSTRFDKTLEGSWRDGPKMLKEWHQVANSHFLGILHLDEIQNLFKLLAIKRRASAKAKEAPPEISIGEDQCLKWILTLINEGQIAVLFSGTPDGIGALTKRVSITQRMLNSGYHPFKHFTAALDPVFLFFLEQLAKYQYVAKPLQVSTQLAELLIEKTAGVHRLIIALWIAAHRVAFERSTDDLRLEDFRKAADTYLAPAGPAVAAVLSNDPKRMGEYEDLAAGNTAFWAQFWDCVEHER